MLHNCIALRNQLVHRFFNKSIIFFNTSYPKHKKFYKKEFDTTV
ncbi:hypothetical protein HMPREF9554_00152 [Treponema phagedenis F0421]|nr:hypothetical protein HMPREF9554_00152 [Treponema phagedenis F0421]